MPDDWTQIDLLQSEIKKCRLDEKSLQNRQQLGMISQADVAIERNMIKKREFQLKVKLVNKVHITSNGKQRSIVHHDNPTESYPKGYWYTKVQGRKVIKAKTEEDLYERLYDYYFGTTVYTVNDVFELALRKKEVEENPKKATIDRYRYDFEKYFSVDFQNRDITSITDSDLKSYVQNLVTSTNVTKKRFLAFKGILNLIFVYAYTNGMIDTNPVSRIKNSVYLKSCNCRKADSNEKILSPEEIQRLIETAREQTRKGYYPYRYALEFSANTGCRVGELCALRWRDIDYDQMVIHICSQQLSQFQDGHTFYYLAEYTKAERGLTNDGRLFPLTDELIRLLEELQEVQSEKGIHSEFVFCLANGEWMNTKGYCSYFRRVCLKCGISVTNNHALRMSLNSNVLIPNGMSVADRAKLLGHSVQTNLAFYSYAEKDYLEKAMNILNTALYTDREPQGNHYGIMQFKKEKAHERRIHKAFS